MARAYCLAWTRLEERLAGDEGWTYRRRRGEPPHPARLRRRAPGRRGNRAHVRTRPRARRARDPRRPRAHAGRPHPGRDAVQHPLDDLPQRLDGDDPPAGRVHERPQAEADARVRRDGRAVRIPGGSPDQPRARRQPHGPAQPLARALPASGGGGQDRERAQRPGLLRGADARPGAAARGRPQAHAGLGVELGEEAGNVQRLRHHRDPDAIFGPRPFVLGPVTVELDAVRVGITEIDRLTHAMVARPVERDAGVGDAPHRVRERAPVRVADSDVEEAGRPRRRGRTALRLPRVQADVMMVSAGRDEGRVRAVALLELEAENAAVEVERAVDVGDLQVHVADVHARIDGAGRGRRFHAAIVRPALSTQEPGRALYLVSDMSSKPVEQLSQVIVRFAGDSGDGMQLTGSQFTSEAALLGNDISTLPDFPAEIRAPAGSLPGVSGFQLHFADHDILTPGDAPNVLVAMNPAALKTNIKDLPKGGTLIVNADAFTERNLDKAGYDANPLEDGSLEEFHVHAVPLTTMTIEALKDVDVTKREAERSKNMFALGLMSWLYNRPTEGTLAFLARKFASKPEIAEANVKAFNAGYAFGETTEEFAVSYEIAPAKLRPGTYRNITGNTALAYGLIAASVKSGLPLFLGAYPITPASSILEELARHKNFGVRTFQAEDEIAAVGAALGASFGGSLGVCTSAGPGVVLKSETVGLAVALELPLLILDIQRAGPSTGMPTKPEQADLLMVLFGRNAESPVPVVAASTPGGCFDAALEAARIALKYRTPVYLLSDAYLANGSEPWLLPDVAALCENDAGFTTEVPADGEFLPYARDDETLARPWAIPGTPGLEHRIGGLEKQDLTGNVSYDPENHDLMTRLRAQKVAGIASDIPQLEVDDPDGADLLVLSWGGTYGPVAAGVRRVRGDGGKVAHAHLHYLNPLPSNTGEVVGAYERVLIPEINLGQLRKLIRAEFLVDAAGFNLVRGLPFRASEVQEAIEAML